MSSGRRAGLPAVDVTEPLVLVVTGQVSRADVPRLCEELRLLLHGAGAAGRAPSAVDCDVGGLVRPGLAAVEAVAGLRLTALRHGRRIRLRNAPPELTELLALTGLAEPP
ncbi:MULTISPECIES: STAS domain-containing protein [unclassified Streptomyces]|uniref:STAS domain-containing protein n=1 Tax=unclassified Streptomyces TaxID=2593676 RepID=UPI002E104118|nr:STAS domain-containing protein [Streptomyces sp. NBC_01197]WSS51214.1 STAS domain-containing protein [Streptomyces sp. NBC_01180]